MPWAHTGDTGEAPDSSFLISPVLIIMVIWQIDHSLSLPLTRCASVSSVSPSLCLTLSSKINKSLKKKRPCQKSVINFQITISNKVKKILKKSTDLYNKPARTTLHSSILFSSSISAIF